MKSREVLVIAIAMCLMLTGKLFAGVNDGLLAWYAFSGNANDGSGNGYNGTVNGATLTNDRFGNSNSAYYFNGSGNYIGLGNPAGLNFTGQITIAVWIRPDAITGNVNRNIVAHGYGGLPIKEVYLRTANYGQYEIGSYIQDSGFTGRAEYSIPLADQGNWVHLVGLYDGSFWKLYRNGIEVASKPIATGAVQVSADWAIGARGTGSSRFFTGAIDEVRIYNRALNASEVIELYNSSPVACIADVNQPIEAQGSFGAKVTLDGACSSDADSAPGTNDDINDFNWYEVIDPCNPANDIVLGSGQIIDCNLTLGTHTIALEVTDKAGQVDSNEITVTVQDTTPPDFELSVSPAVLWPANHKMIQINPTWVASDTCDQTLDISLVDITTDDESVTGDDILINPDGSIYLRAERSKISTGRVYTITYKACDDSGNCTVQSATVAVLHDKNK